MTTLPLRPYQLDALTKIDDTFREGVRRTAVVLPTGSGKTVIFSNLAQHWEQGRALILVHREELIDQAVNKLRVVAPGLKVGVVKAERNEHQWADVIVGSVQTLRKLARLDEVQFTGEVGLLIVDECHHATAASYQTIMTELGCFDPDSDVRAVGFTATLSRADGASLGSTWQNVCYQRDILDMINEGYLCDVAGKMVTVDGLSLSEVAMAGGDYQLGSLSEALLSADAPEFVAKAYLEQAGDMPGIVFTPTVETAHAFALALNQKGIRARSIWGAMDRDYRRDLIGKAHSGNVQVLVNCMVLTEGFDWPAAQCVVIARPTTSPGLYVQMAGRCLRPWPGKDRALILDVVGASQEHSLAALTDLTSRRVLQIVEGESLLEAVTREREAQNPALRDYAVTYRDVDLFARSHAAWLQTYQGVWFVSTRSHVYFVWPGSVAGLYHLGRRPVGVSGGDWLHKDVSLDYAMAWGTAEAIKENPMVAMKNRSWRKKGGPPSPKMVSYARAKGVPGADQARSKNELSTMIDVHIVSKMLDKALIIR